MVSVSVIVPCRNEVDYITQFVNSVLEQDFLGIIEVIIADGMSDDGTLELIQSSNDKRVSVINNPQMQVSSGLNAAISKASGDIIIRMDVHCIYPPNYISALVGHISKSKNVGNVGPSCKTSPGGKGIVPLAISLVMASSWGVGNSSFRVDDPQHVKKVDTVPFGCWRRDVFDEVGYFDVELVRNQDDEFNQRILSAGYEIHLIPRLSVTYFSRKSLLDHAKMFYQYGLFKPLVNKKAGRVTTLRQLAPPLLVLYSLLCAFLSLFYIGLSAFFCLLMLLGYCIATVSIVRARGYSLFKLYWVCIITLFLTHISYGFGYLKGLVFTPRHDVSLSR